MAELFQHDWTRGPRFTSDHRQNRFEQNTAVQLRTTWRTNDARFDVVLIESDHLRLLACSTIALNNRNASWYFVSTVLVFVAFVRRLASSSTVKSRMTWEEAQEKDREQTLDTNEEDFIPMDRVFPGGFIERLLIEEVVGARFFQEFQQSLDITLERTIESNSTIPSSLRVYLSFGDGAGRDETLETLSQGYFNTTHRYSRSGIEVLTNWTLVKTNIAPLMCNNDDWHGYDSSRKTVYLIWLECTIHSRVRDSIDGKSLHFFQGGWGWEWTILCSPQNTRWHSRRELIV